MDLNYWIPFTQKANTGFHFYQNEGTFTRVLRMFREETLAKLSRSIQNDQNVMEAAEAPERTSVIFDSLYEAVLLVMGNNLNQYGTVDQKKEQTR